MRMGGGCGGEDGCTNGAHVCVYTYALLAKVFGYRHFSLLFTCSSEVLTARIQMM